MQTAQTDYDKVSWRPEVGTLPQSAALQTATLAYEKAKAAYNTATEGASDSEIASARASVARDAHEGNHPLRMSGRLTRDPKRARYGCFLPDLTGLARRLPAPTSHRPI